MGYHWLVPLFLGEQPCRFERSRNAQLGTRQLQPFFHCMVRNAKVERNFLGGFVLQSTAQSLLLSLGQPFDQGLCIHGHMIGEPPRFPRQGRLVPLKPSC